MVGISFAITEEGIIKAALKNSYGITLQRIEVEKDSLLLQKSEVLLQPQTLFSLSGEVVPLDTLKSLTDSSGFRSSTGISLSKAFSKGGILSGSISATGYRGFDEGTAGSSVLSLDYSQPLFKGAWDNSDYSYTVAMNSLELDQERLKLRSKVIDALSEVRTALITLEGYQIEKEILQQRIEKAKRRHNESLALLKAGKKTHLDTLSSYLNQLQIERESFNLQADMEDQKSLVAYICGIELDENIQFSTQDPVFPDSDLLYNEALQHPDLSLFEVVQNSLSEQIKKQQNSMLPDVNATIGVSRQGSGEHFWDESSSRATLSIGLSGTFSLPLSSIRQDIAILQRSKKSIELQQSDKEAYLRYEVKTLERVWKRHMKLLDLREKEVAVAETLFTATEKAFKNGGVSSLAYEDSEADLFEAKMALAAQKIALQTISVNLEKITGRVLKRYGVTL